MPALSTEIKDRLRTLIEDLPVDLQQEGLLITEQVHGQKSSRWAFIVNLLGVDQLSVERGHVHCELPVTRRLHNSHGGLHGGALFTVVDYTMFRATSSLMDSAKGERCTTIELKINYVAPMFGGKVIVDTQIVNAGKRIFVIESRVTNGDGALVALATGSYYISRPAR